MYCRNCGVRILKSAVRCPNCGTSSSKRSRLIYIVLAICLGYFGVHNLYARRTMIGLIQLLATTLFGWLGGPMLLMSLWVGYEIFTVKRDGWGIPFN